jgi:flagella synthesis protein FlgN
MEEINAITNAKNRVINTLNQLGQARKQALFRLGLPHVEKNLELYLQDQDQRDCWAKLMAQTKKAKEVNRVNGMLITRHMIRNQSTLQVLYQHHRNTSIPTLYSANGQSNPQRNLHRGFGC